MKSVQQTDLERVLLGCALGDSLGLPFEGLSPKKCSRLLPKELRHTLFFGKGMLYQPSSQTYPKNNTLR